MADETTNQTEAEVPGTEAHPASETPQTQGKPASRRAEVRVPGDLERGLRRFGSVCGDYLSVITRTHLNLNLNVAQRAGRAEMNEALSAPAWRVGFELPGSGRRGALLINSSLVLYVLECFYGNPAPILSAADALSGEGEAGEAAEGTPGKVKIADKPSRMLTDIEERLAREIAGEILGVFAEAVSGSALPADGQTLRILPGSVERLLSGEDTSGSWMARFACGEVSNAITLIIPSLSELMDVGAAQLEAGFALTLLKANVEISVAIGTVFTTVDAASRLGVGDVLAINAPTQNKLEVRVQDSARFWAVPVISRGMRSIKITGSNHTQGS